MIFRQNKWRRWRRIAIMFLRWWSMLITRTRRWWNRTRWTFTIHWRWWWRWTTSWSGIWTFIWALIWPRFTEARSNYVKRFSFLLKLSYVFRSLSLSNSKSPSTVQSIASILLINYWKTGEHKTSNQSI